VSQSGLGIRFDATTGDCSITGRDADLIPGAAACIAATAFQTGRNRRVCCTTGDGACRKSGFAGHRCGVKAGMTPILQSHLPFAPWMDPRTHRLPGVLPVAGDDWLRVDDAFGPQMAERDRLIATVPDVVHGIFPAAHDAAAELFARVIDHLRATPGYLVADDCVTRPDGVTVPLDGPPLLTLGRLVQEDLCLMQRHADESVLTGAILCFPASWSLAEKLGRPLTGIHAPVTPYTDDIARRVQRMFDAIRVDQPLWRANALVYVDPALHQPRRESDPRTDRRGGTFLRSERQGFLRLPVSRAVVFSIHTYVVRLGDLTPDQHAAMGSAGL